LDVDQLSVLSKGLNFAVTPSSIPKRDIIAGVECAIDRMNQETKSVIRQKVSKILRSAKRPNSNLTRGERAAIASLRANEDIIILPSDKGNMVVVLDKKDYIAKLESLITSGPYETVPKDPGKSYRKVLYEKLRDAYSSERIDKSLLLRLCPTFFQTPHLFGLPKVHKPGTPLRPIVSQFSSLFSGVSRYLADVFYPFLANSNSFVLNSVDLKQKLVSDTHSNEGFFVSFDVESLFTNVPIDGALEAFRRCLSDDPSLSRRCALSISEVLELAEFVLRHSYFEFGSRIFVQVEGVSMGSSLGPVAACLFMDFFERETFSVARSTGIPCPELWIRYVDDVLARCSFSEDDLLVFLEFINSRVASIRFTMERESDGCLPFLDLLIKRSDNKLSFSVFRKPTRTDLYLNRSSCHPESVFKGIVRSLGLRASQLCSADHLPSERAHLLNTLSRNGYSRRDCAGLRVSVTPSRCFSRPSSCIPYVPVVCEKIRKVLSEFDVSIALRPHSTLRSSLVRKRPSPATILGCVYQLPCSEPHCSFVYVGESGRPLQERQKEHMRAVRDLDVDRSELAKHVHESNHKIDFAGMHCLEREGFWKRRIAKEALWSRILKSSNATKIDLGHFYDNLF
jgi:hypothetical protein